MSDQYETYATVVDCFLSHKSENSLVSAHTLRTKAPCVHLHSVRHRHHLINRLTTAAVTALGSYSHFSLFYVKSNTHMCRISSTITTKVAMIIPRKNPVPRWALQLSVADGFQDVRFRREYLCFSLTKNEKIQQLTKRGHPTAANKLRPRLTERTRHYPKPGFATWFTIPWYQAIQIGVEPCTK